LKRLPITELGCAAGAAALGHAGDYLRAYPDRTVLVLAAELTSATFQLKDLSKANLVASLLFGDGVAATVVSGRVPRRRSPHLLGSKSVWFPDSTDLMGFELRATGFHLILSPRIPAVVIFVLEELWRNQEPAPGALGVLAAFGPAFGAEASLLGWDEPG